VPLRRYRKGSLTAYSRRDPRGRHRSI